MKFIIRFLFIFFAFTVIANANSFIDINEKIEQAKKENKTIMFFFHIPNCPYCKAMIDENFKDSAITKLIKEHFILIDIYTEDTRAVEFENFKGSTREFAKYIGAYAYPATLFIDQNGSVVHKAIGYRNIQEYIFEIKYIATNIYKEMKLDEFILKMELEDDD